MKTRHELLELLFDVCRTMKQARDERHARTGAMQEAATLARRGGPRGREVIDRVERQHPIVHDVSDIVDRICEAVDAVEKNEQES